MVKMKRTSSKKNNRPRARLTKAQVNTADDTVSNEANDQKGIKRAFFKLEELGRRLRGQKENLVIDWEFERIMGQGGTEKEGDKSVEGVEEASLPVLHRLAAPACHTTSDLAQISHPAAPPPTPTTHRTIQSSSGNIFINGGQSHRLSLSRHWPSSPPRPGDRIAIQNSDPELGEDTLILSTLNNSVEQPLPFCCHEDLLTMTQEQLIEVANTLNASLPIALAIKTQFRYAYGPTELRRAIERVVGINLDTNATPTHPRQGVVASSTGSDIPSTLRRGVAPSAFTEDFGPLDFPSPPTSPLARTKYAQFSSSLLSPTSRLSCLEEEPSDLDDTLLRASSRNLAGQGVSPLLPNPWDDGAVFADVSDNETDIDPNVGETSMAQPIALASLSSIPSIDSDIDPEPTAKVRRTQSMRAHAVLKQDAPGKSERILRSQSQRAAAAAGSSSKVEMKKAAKERRTSIGMLAGKDTSFITTRRPSYRSKVVEGTEDASGSSLRRSQSENRGRGRGGRGGAIALGRRCTFSGAHTLVEDDAIKHRRSRSAIPVSVAGSKRKRQSALGRSTAEEEE